VSTSFSTQLLILLSALHVICWQQAKQRYEKDLIVISWANATGAKKVVIITIDAKTKVAQVGAKRGDKL